MSFVSVYSASCARSRDTKYIIHARAACSANRRHLHTRLFSSRLIRKTRRILSLSPLLRALLRARLDETLHPVVSRVPTDLSARRRP